MATLAPPNLYKMYTLLNPHLSSLRIGGIVGDTRHVAGGGYHISRDDLRNHGQSSDYSIQAPADRRGPGNYAAAIDISLNPAEMVTVSKRLRAAMEGHDYDDRIEPLREFIGTVDNRNVCGYNRYQTVYPNGDTGRRTGWYPSGYSEASHLWHVHLSFFRDYCNSVNDIAGVAEVICGLKPGTLGWKKPDTTSGDGRPAPVLPKPHRRQPVPKGHFRVGGGPKKGRIYRSPRKVSVKWINSRRKSGKFSRHVWFLQHWLNKAGYKYGPSTGYFDAKTQRLYNEFRRDGGYQGGDAKGAVGVESLTKLRAKAHATKKVI